MKIVTLLLLAGSSIAAGTAYAQEELPVHPCDACRDLVDYPEDGRNFSVNLLLADDGRITLDDADRFFIEDNFGNRVMVDMNLEFVDTSFFDLFRLPLGNELMVAELMIQVRIIYANLQIVSYLFTTSDIFALPLPVGDANEPVAASDTSSGGQVADFDGADDGDEEDGGWTDEGEYEVPEPEWPDGVTGIEDPDENGDFAEWIVEL